VLPPSLVGAALRCKWISDRCSSRLIERAIAELLRSGDYDRHIRRMQRRYRERRDVLIRSLRHHFGSAAEIEGSSAGLHLIAWLPQLPPSRVHAVVSRCLEQGVGIYPLTTHARRPLSRAALIFGYGIVQAGDIDRGVEGVALACAAESGRRGDTEHNRHGDRENTESIRRAATETTEGFRRGGAENTEIVWGRHGAAEGTEALATESRRSLPRS